MDPMDLDFFFDRIPRHPRMHWKKVVVGKKASLNRLESAGSRASSSHEPLQQAKGQLAFDDAKEKMM